MSEKLEKLLETTKGLSNKLGDVPIDLKLFEELLGRDGAKLIENDKPISGTDGYIHRISYDRVFEFTKDGKREARFFI